MRMFAIAACLAALCPAQDPAAADQSPQQAFEAFEQRGGQWIAQWHPATGTPSAIYGTGLPLADWRENSLEEARRHALRLIAEHGALLGTGSSEFREISSGRMGRTWAFVFDQFFRDLPVIEGRVDVRINMKGVVAMLGSRAWPIPAAFDVTPAIADTVAEAIAWNTLGQDPTGVPQPGRAARPRLVIWGDTAATTLAPFFLAWEVLVSNVDAQGNGPIGRYYVDARTGAVLHWLNDKHECGRAGCTTTTHATLALAAPPIQTTVTVQGWTRSGADAWSTLVNEPLPGVVLSVPGIGNVTTDQNGQFTIDIAAPVNISFTTLDGRHHNPISGADALSASITVNPGVNTTLQLLTSAATTNEAAHTTLTYWVDKTNEWCRSLLGNSAQLATASNIGVQANIASTCNAYYTANTINFYNQGGNCANTAFSTVIAHEWGHGIDDRYGGIANTNADGLSEGWGDILGLYLVDSPLLGSGFQTPGVALRRGDNSFLYPYSGSSPHAAGQVWMGFAWRLRERLRTAFGTQTAIAISNDIVITTLVADATTRVDAVREVFIADDDDGNLLNGTPNYAHLSGAAIDKAIPYPEVQVATIAHTPLGSTLQRLTPRMVNATATPLSGSITLVRLHYNAGAGNQQRNMHPNGATNGWQALLPGVAAGSVSYHIEAVHSGGTTVRLPASGEWSYEVIGSAQTFWSQNFDGAVTGWTSAQVATQNDWQVGDPAGKSGTSGGIAWADPQNAASAPNCYGNDLGNTIGGTVWNGAYGINVENYLRSPVIDCTGRVGVKLRFKRWLTVEEGLFDQATILVNGVQVWQNPANGHTVDTSWQTVEYLLPMADNNPNVQLEWRLKSDGGVQLGGWNIDDVELRETVSVVVDAELRVLPEQAVQGAPLVVTINTPGNPRPWFLVYGDQPGPTALPGFPLLLVGGTVDFLFGVTDAGGVSTFGLNAPTVASAIGLQVYSQVLTTTPDYAAYTTSNQHLNLFTQTP